MSSPRMDLEKEWIAIGLRFKDFELCSLKNFDWTKNELNDLEEGGLTVLKSWIKSLNTSDLDLDFGLTIA